MGDSAPALIILRALLAAVAAVALVGCGDDGEPEAGEPEPISFERTGGLAGTRVLLEIGADREATLTEGSAGDEATTRFTLDPAEFAKLQARLRAAELDRLSRLEPEGGPTCADCFEYRLRFGPASIEATGETLPTAVEPGVRLLGEIVERESPGGPGVAGGVGALRGRR